MKKHLDTSSDHYLTAIVALGHISYNLPHIMTFHVKNTISRKIVRELLVVDPPEASYDGGEEPWCAESELEHTTQCKVSRTTWPCSQGKYNYKLFKKKVNRKK